MKKIVTKEGKTLKRVSRWIRIQQNYNPSRRNPLWHYVTDGNGYHEYQCGYDPSTGLFLDFFRWNGRNWALEQFIRLGGMMGGAPYTYEDDDGKLGVIGAYDSENYYDPILIEIDDCGEYVRVYEEDSE